jgi:hypothetical protein
VLHLGMLQRIRFEWKAAQPAVSTVATLCTELIQLEVVLLAFNVVERGFCVRFLLLFSSCSCYLQDVQFTSRLRDKPVTFTSESERLGHQHVPMIVVAVEKLCFFTDLISWCSIFGRSNKNSDGFILSSLDKKEFKNMYVLAFVLKNK